MERLSTPARLVYLVDEIREAHDDLVEALAVFQVYFFHFSVLVRLSAWPLS
jgi:hypothetical protein